MRGRVVQKSRYDLALKVFVQYKEYLLDGKPVSEAEYLAAFPERPMSESALCTAETGAQLTPTTFEPIHSLALAYHPKQRKEAEAHLAKLGVPTQVDSHGCPILRDRSHRKAVLKALGKHSLNSYYGD